MGRVIPFIACVLVHTIASATVLVPAEFREIVGGSEIIAHARIVDVRPQWADGRRWVDSIVTAEVVASLKGNAADTITFKVPGGQLGRYRSVVIGAPVFAKGDEAILFLKHGDDEWPGVFGLNQGVFRVRRDAHTGQQLVVPPVMAASVQSAASTAEGVPVRRGAVERKPMPIEAFGARVREAMAAKPAAQARSSKGNR